MSERLWRRARVPALLVGALPLMALASAVSFATEDEQSKSSHAPGSTFVTPGAAPVASASIAIYPLDRPGAVDTLPSGINDKGAIVGTSEDATQVANNTEEGFLLQGSSFATIFFPDATDTNGGAVNNKGVVFGTYDIRGAIDPTTDGDFCFTFSNAKGYKAVATPFPTGAQFFDCNGNNDKGAIVGSFEDVDGNSHGFLIKGNLFIQLNAPFAGTYQTEAYDINNEGDIVGTFSRTNVNDTNDGAFLLHKGKYTEIKVPGSTSVDAFGLNDKGAIVGAYTDTNGDDHGFLWSKGKITTIDVPFANTETNKVTGINNKGSMVGVYTNINDDTEHGFKATQ